MSILSRAQTLLSAFQRRLGLGNEAAARQSLTLVATGCTFVGNLETLGSLRIEGRLEGDGRVQGGIEVVRGGAIIGVEVRCQDLVIAGLVEANVVAEGAVTIATGGCIRGSVCCRALQVAPGAELSGAVKVSELASGSPLPALPPLTAATGPRFRVSGVVVA